MADSEWEYTVDELEGGENPELEGRDSSMIDSEKIGGGIGGLVGAATIDEAWDYGYQAGESISPELGPVGGLLASGIYVTSTTSLGYGAALISDYVRSSGEE